MKEIELINYKKGAVAPFKKIKIYESYKIILKLF
jgi:hypothetical protein